jgi:hypothetical protein
MRDNDEFKDIPSLVLSREDVVERQSSRKQSDIESTPRYGEVVKVSTWPVRIMLALLTLTIGGGAWLGSPPFSTGRFYSSWPPRSVRVVAAAVSPWAGLPPTRVGSYRGGSNCPLSHGERMCPGRSKGRPPP